MEHSDPSEKNEQLNEPLVPYGTRRLGKLQIFKSFEEAAEAEALQYALQAPIERIRETVELILRTYGVTREQLIARRKKLHITIGRQDSYL